MADSLSPTSPEYINVNCDSKPDTSKFNKDLSFNKDDVNQNKGFPSKCSSSDKFKNSPLLPDKKHLLSPRSSPQPRRVSPSQPEQKVINSPPPVVEQFISPSPVKEEKIINSPRSARSSVSNSQEFRIVNPTSRSASVSSQVESPLHSSQDFLVKRDRSQSDNDSLGDAEILELLSDDATEGPPVDKTVKSGNLDDVFGDSANSTSEAVNISSETIHLNTENDENSAYQNTDEIGMNNGNDLYHNENELWMNNSNDMMLINDDLLDETIAELQLIEAEGLADVSYDKDIHGPIEIIQNRSSAQFDTEEALSGLLEIAEMADDFGLTDDSVDDMSQVMSVWIEESIDNLKDMLKRTIQRPTSKRNQYVENSDSPLSRFSQPSTFEKRLAAKLTLESLKDQSETGASPTPNQEGGRRKPKPISQSESGDFTGSSRASPSGEYGSSFNSGSNFNSEPPSRSYTPSYNESFTPSDASDNSDTESSPEHFVPTGIRKPGGSATRGLPTRGGQKTGVRGRATGVRRVRPSYSGEHLGGLVESSSAESFVSNKSEDPGDHPRGGSLSGLRKPTATSTPRGLARPRPVNTATLPRPSNLGIQSPNRKQNSPQPPKSNIAKPGALQKMKPSGLQKPGAARGIPKPSGIARGAAKSARGAGRPGLKKPATSKGSWDEGCY
ncbi:uncharacterized protein LOC134817770 isoform X2 [Bolinopsis microptera]|uniref:uncharacterized protein LOC134817770 isoform X2 n=1 Tax=Bolinopsis microptera TaxID=2820187 RepID=UPI00307AC78A